MSQNAAGSGNTPAPDLILCSCLCLLCSASLIDLLLHAGISATSAANGAKEAANIDAAAGPASAKLGAAKKTLKVPVKAPSTAPVKAPADSSVKPTVKAAAKPAIGKTTSDTTATTIAPSPAASAKGKASSSKAETAPKAPRAKNAYMFFLADKRQGVKGDAQEHQAMMYEPHVASWCRAINSCSGTARVRDFSAPSASSASNTVSLPSCATALTVVH